MTKTCTHRDPNQTITEAIDECSRAVSEATRLLLSRQNTRTRVFIHVYLWCARKWLAVLRHWRSAPWWI